MLERNRADDFTKKPLAVTMVLDSGETFDGNLFVRFPKNIYGELNNEKDFVEFHDENGLERFVSKSKITSIIPKK